MSAERYAELRLAKLQLKAARTALDSALHYLNRSGDQFSAAWHVTGIAAADVGDAIDAMSDDAIDSVLNGITPDAGEPEGSGQ